MSFQTRKTFVYLWNINYDIFYEIREFSNPAYNNATDMFKAQKGSKHIGKIVHVTSVVQPSFYEAMRILFCANRKQK